MTAKSRKKRPYSHKLSRNEELVREIKYLRSISKDVIDRYSLRVQGCLVNMVRILETSPTNRQKVRKPIDKKMREMISSIRSIKIKAKKGRAKDLVRIEALAKKLDGLMPSQP